MIKSLRSLISQTFILLVVFSSCSEEKTNSIKLSEEVLQIRQPILELYENLKVEDGKTPNFEFIYSLFTETANLGYVKEDSLILKSPEVVTVPPVAAVNKAPNTLTLDSFVYNQPFVASI